MFKVEVTCAVKMMHQHRQQNREILNLTMLAFFCVSPSLHGNQRMTQDDSMVSVNQNADKKSLFFIQIFLWIDCYASIKLYWMIWLRRGPHTSSQTIYSADGRHHNIEYPFPVQYRGTDKVTC
jgi:hypothetical protein